MDAKMLIEHLRKAGVNASLVSRVHDSEVVHISNELTFKELEERILALANVQDIEPVITAYQKRELIGGSITDEQAKEIAENMRRIYREALEAGKENGFGVNADRVVDSINRHGYLETAWGGRRHICRKSTMDDNDTLR